MPTTTINGHDVAVDDEGFMTEYDQWDEETGKALAIGDRHRHDR